MADSERCPHCGSAVSPILLAVRKMYTGKARPPSMAEAARRLGVSRQRVHQIVKQLGVTPSRKGRNRKGSDPADQEPAGEPEEPAAETAIHEHVGQAVGASPGVVKERCSCGAIRRVVRGVPEEWSV